MVLLFLESPLNHDDSLTENFYHILLYLFIIIIASYYFLTCGENPGWVPCPSGDKNRHLSSAKYYPPFDFQPNTEGLEIGLVQKSLNTNSFSSINEQELNEINDEIQFKCLDKKDKKFLRKLETESDEETRENKDNLPFLSVPPKHFCNVCHIEQEYRTRHCHKCEKCIYKYDHHCFWIGESNSN